MKIKKISKLTQLQIIEMLKSKSINWSPLQVDMCREVSGFNGEFDVELEVSLPEGQSFKFLAEIISLATPLNLNSAIQQIKNGILRRGSGWHPMIIAPYLSPERLDELQKAEITGLDLSGNCVVTVSGRLFVLRTGKANAYPQASTLVNPYACRSSLVCRMFLLHHEWKSLKALVQAINGENGSISMGQASKALDILCEELLIAKNPGCIKLVEAQRLLDNLVQNFKKPKSLSVQSLKLGAGLIWQERLGRGGLNWVVSGETSARYFSSIGESGPWKVYVSDMRKALENLEGTPEKVSHFADVELIYTNDPCVWFDTSQDADGIIWASKIQTFLELMTGDARQREIAQSLRKKILTGVK
ncbi:MAG: hypothetical protein WAX69_26995 [Victivallales bacterium]